MSCLSDRIEGLIEYENGSKVASFVHGPCTIVFFQKHSDIHTPDRFTNPRLKENATITYSAEILPYGSDGTRSSAEGWAGSIYLPEGQKCENVLIYAQQPKSEWYAAQKRHYDKSDMAEFGTN